MRRTAGAAVLVFAVLWLGGCTQAPGVATSSAGASGAPASDGDVVAAARAGGASQEQLAILGRGVITFVDYEAAVGRTIACMRSAGLDVVGDTPVDKRGFPEIPYSYGGAGGVSDDQAQAVGDDCITEHSKWVEMVYQTQPTTIEAIDKRFERYRAAVVACIRKNGGSITDTPSAEQADDASFDVLNKTGVDCMKEAGAR